MNTAMVNILIKYPSVFFLNFIIEPLAGAALAYGLVWLVMRPKAAKQMHNPFLWHSCGVAATVIGSAIFRIIAMVTFAGRSAYEPDSKTGAAGFYMLLIPAIIAAGYIAWLKRRPTAIGHATPDLKASDVIADTSTIDATYEKIDQELKTDNLDCATWTRAQGDAEGNAERAKALYIKYRAQRLLAASRDESAHQSNVDAVSVEKPAKKYNSRIVAATAGILGVAVVAVIVIGFFTEKPAPTKGEDRFKPLDFSAYSTPVPEPPDPAAKSGERRNLVPFPARAEITMTYLDKLAKGGSDTEIAARFGLTLQEYKRRDARGNEICLEKNFLSFDCMTDVLAGRR